MIVARGDDSELQASTTFVVIAARGGAKRDCLAADGPQLRFVPEFQPTGDLFGRPSLGEPITHEQTQSGLSFEDRFTPPAQLIGSGGVKRRIPARGSAFRCSSLEMVVFARPSARAMAPIDRPAARKTPIWSLSSSDRCE